MTVTAEMPHSEYGILVITCHDSKSDLSTADAETPSIVTGSKKTTEFPWEYYIMDFGMSAITMDLMSFLIYCLKPVPIQVKRKQGKASVERKNQDILRKKSSCQLGCEER